MQKYAELHSHSYFSLLDASSSPEDLVQRAAELGLAGLALTDHDSLGGAVRFWTATRRADLHAILGAELTLADGSHLTLLAETQQGYANLCRLITRARLPPAATAADPSPATPWPGKVLPALPWEALAEHNAGLIALTGCRRGAVAQALLHTGRATGGATGEEQARQALARLCDLFGPDRLFVEVQHHGLPDDDRLVRRLLALAKRMALPAVATHNAHYATADSAMLRDALIAVRHNETLAAAQRAGHLPFNHAYALQSPEAMARRFAQRPDLLRATLAIAERCQATLDFSGQRLPRLEMDPFPFLYQLCHDRLPRCYPKLRPVVLKQLAHELDIIEQAGLAGYFLVVWDIVRFAREQGIRCQGRGSAANSIVAYLLGITSIDPLAHDLLFERFLSSDKFTMPDIDVDFAADRREEVIQYVYNKYGRDHTAMVCNVVTYQARSALRDLGKVLELPEASVEQLAKRLDAHGSTQAAEQLTGQLADAAPPHLLTLLRQIDGCPRHLSIHSGGMLITGAPLDQIVPLEPATMPGRTVCQWDKDSVEDAGLIKIDLLALRTLGVISETLVHLEAAGQPAPDLDALPLDNPAIYAMLQHGDTIGAFQVESRAQQQMLPRLKPQRFEDIVVEVAIVRPGPIQGGAVHPYLRRRTGAEKVSYLHPSLEPVLAETLGVLLFQEQAIRVAVAAAGFTPGEADLLRRALSRSRSQEAMAALQGRFIRGAADKGIDPAVAQAIFDQLARFAGYGFCKSHAASFALIAYQTLWLKHYHAAAFYCALLNQQPMGFYPPEVLLGDARRHGVPTLPPDVNRSLWNYRLEAIEPGAPGAGDARPGEPCWALRTGLRMVADFGEQAWQRLEAARSNQGRGDQPFTGLEDLCQRTRLPVDALRSLIRAGACDSFGGSFGNSSRDSSGNRRQLLWRLGELDYRPDALDLPQPAIAADLPPLSALEQTVWEYELMGASPNAQIMVHYRPHLRAAGIASGWQVKQMQPGQRARTAGFVVVRQRPSTAKGILFMSLEDESGLLDLVVKPETYARLRDVLRGQPLILAEGIVQRSGRAVSLLVQHAEPLGE